LREENSCYKEVGFKLKVGYDIERAGLTNSYIAVSDVLAGMRSIPKVADETLTDTEDYDEDLFASNTQDDESSTNYDESVDEGSNSSEEDEVHWAAPPLGSQPRNRTTLVAQA
jgi:hypothetical protein